MKPPATTYAMTVYNDMGGAWPIPNQAFNITSKAKEVKRLFEMDDRCWHVNGTGNGPAVEKEGRTIFINHTYMQRVIPLAAYPGYPDPFRCQEYSPNQHSRGSIVTPQTPGGEWVYTGEKALVISVSYLYNQRFDHSQTLEWLYDLKGEVWCLRCARCGESSHELGYRCEDKWGWALVVNSPTPCQETHYVVYCNRERQWRKPMFDVQRYKPPPVDTETL